MTEGPKRMMIESLRRVVQPLQYLTHRLDHHLLLVHRFSLRATTYCDRTRSR